MSKKTMATGSYPFEHRSKNWLTPCATVGKATEKMITAYIEQQEKALSKDVFSVSDDWSASAEMSDFQSYLYICLL